VKQATKDADLSGGTPIGVAPVDDEWNRSRGGPHTFLALAREWLQADDQIADLEVRNGVAATGGDKRANFGARSGVAATGGDDGDGGGGHPKRLVSASPHSDAHGDDRKLHTQAPLAQIQALVDGSWTTTHGKV
jgi:hypothetical protein